MRVNLPFSFMIYYLFEAGLTMATNEGTLSSLISTVQDIEDNLSMSLTQYTKKVTINSRTYIDSTLREDAILAPLMDTILNLYTGFILTAVNMNAYITDTKRVRDYMAIVATESLANHVPVGNLIKSSFGSLAPKVMRNRVMDEEEEEMAYQTELTAGDTEVKQLAPKYKSNVASGRMIKVEMGIGKTKTAVDMLIQLHPTYVPNDVMSQFISLNFTPTFRQRYMQAKAGEISTFKDLILGMDLRRARLAALKKDKGGLLTDMLDRQMNSRVDAWLKLFQVIPQKQNIANTILIFDKANFDTALSASGFKFNEFKRRQDFFNKAFAMMVCVVDMAYNNVEIYYHGLETKSEFTYDQLKANQGVDKLDILQIMKNYSAGAAPKF